MKDVEGCIQVWYADDSSVCGKISQIKKWFSILLDKGPLYGYYPEPTKCFVIVDQSQVDHVRESLSGFGVQVVTSHPVLGDVIGSDIEKEMYIKEKVNNWVHHLDTLSVIALDQPQAAYSAYTLSFQSEWSFLQRVVKCPDQLFQELENTITKRFLPSLFGSLTSTSDRELYSLPVRMGGLNIKNLTTTSSLFFNTSSVACHYLVECIKGLVPYEPETHEDFVLRAKAQHLLATTELNNQLFSKALSQLDPAHQRIISRTRDCISSWLP